MSVALNCHSHFSILQSTATPQELVSSAKEQGYRAVALTDRNSLAGSIQFYKACKEAEIKPILGVDILVRDGEDRHWLTLIARNLAGWKNLLKLVSEANLKDNVIVRKVKKTDYLPSATLEMLSAYADGLVCLTGGVGSYLDALTLRGDGEAAEAWVNRLRDHVVVGGLFGEPALAERLGLPSLPSSTIYGINAEDVETRKILLASLAGTTIDRLSTELPKLGDPVLTSLLTHDHLLPAAEEDRNSLELAESVEIYDILNKPLLPHFDCPNGLSEIDYLRQLCRDGWTNKKKKDWDIVVYGDRVKKELSDIAEGDIAGYLLMVQDIIKEVHRRGYITAPGRGSVSGSLVAYLLDITDVDSIKYDLIWERFWNKGRKDSLPDIDSDVPPECREEVIEYIRQKYGIDKVAQMITFGTMQGRSSLKTVLRVFNVVNPQQADKITADIPDKAKIEGEMQADGEDSYLIHILRTKPTILKDYCRLNKDGNLEGELAEYVEKAIRIENLITSTGKHAAGVVICSSPLDEVCPLVYDKSSDHRLVGFEMNDGEAAGLVKKDVLSTAVLSKMQACERLINVSTNSTKKSN